MHILAIFQLDFAEYSLRKLRYSVSLGGLENFINPLSAGFQNLP
jgi:hypothetical protein